MKAACFGNRTLTGDISQLEENLYNMLEMAVANSVITDFYCGGEIGFDELCAKIVLKLREKYPQIKLHLVLPCSPREQTLKWTDEQRTEYTRILTASDSVEQTSESYYDGCMQKRNTRLIKLADYCFCYLDAKISRDETIQTAKMALAKKMKIVNFFEG